MFCPKEKVNIPSSVQSVVTDKPGPKHTRQYERRRKKFKNNLYLHLPASFIMKVNVVDREVTKINKKKKNQLLFTLHELFKKKKNLKLLGTKFLIHSFFFKHHLLEVFFFLWWINKSHTAYYLKLSKTGNDV